MSTVLTQWIQHTHQDVSTVQTWLTHKTMRMHFVDYENAVSFSNSPEHEYKMKDLAWSPDQEYSVNPMDVTCSPDHEYYNVNPTLQPGNEYLTPLECKPHLEAVFNANITQFVMLLMIACHQSLRQV